MMRLSFFLHLVSSVFLLFSISFTFSPIVWVCVALSQRSEEHVRSLNGLAGSSADHTQDYDHDSIASKATDVTEVMGFDTTAHRPSPTTPKESRGDNERSDGGNVIGSPPVIDVMAGPAWSTSTTALKPNGSNDGATDALDGETFCRPNGDAAATETNNTNGRGDVFQDAVAAASATSPAVATAEGTAPGGLNGVLQTDSGTNDYDSFEAADTSKETHGASDVGGGVRNKELGGRLKSASTEASDSSTEEVQADNGGAAEAAAAAAHHAAAGKNSNVISSGFDGSRGSAVHENVPANGMVTVTFRGNGNVLNPGLTVAAATAAAASGGRSSSVGATPMDAAGNESGATSVSDRSDGHVESSSSQFQALSQNTVSIMVGKERAVAAATAGEVLSSAAGSSESTLATHDDYGREIRRKMPTTEPGTAAATGQVDTSFFYDNVTEDPSADGRLGPTYGGRIYSQPKVQTPRFGRHTGEDSFHGTDVQPPSAVTVR